MSPVAHPQRTFHRVSSQSDRRPPALFIACTLLFYFFFDNVNSFDRYELASRSIGFALLMLLICLICFEVVSRSGKLLLDPLSPERFYSIFFGVYYVLPFALIILDPRITGLRFAEIGAAELLAFFAFRFGCRSVKRHVERPRLSERDARALLVVCWICMLMFGYLYFWRLQHGNFYTHAISYTVGTDTASSLLESFVQHLSGPVFFLCGLIAVSSTSVARLARVTLRVFVMSSFFLFIASSQFRLTATALVLAWVAFNLFGAIEFPWKLAVSFAAVAVFALTVIFTIRASNASSELSQSSNQLADLVRGIASGELVDSRELPQATMGSGGATSLGRAVTPLTFFSEVMDAMDSPGVPFGLGKSFAYETTEILPRLLWKDKPEFLSTQIFIRQEIGLTIVDSSPHPMLQFYYEMGWPGIALGFFLMGWMMRSIVTRMHSMFFFFFLLLCGRR